jgi:hypothetical protein
MLEWLKICNKATHHTPKSARIKNTTDYVNELNKQFPSCSVSSTIRSRSLSLVYEIRMTEDKCKRTDPYTGTQFVYDYLECRKFPIYRVGDEKATSRKSLISVFLTVLIFLFIVTSSL